MTASLFATPPAKCPRCGHWHGDCFTELPNELDLQSARKQVVCACEAKYSATVRHSCGHRINYFSNTYQDLAVLGEWAEGPCPLCGVIINQPQAATWARARSMKHEQTTLPHRLHDGG